MSEIPHSVALKLIRYEPETGRLYWLERDPSKFPANGRCSATAMAEQWNRRKAGREAFTSDDGGYRQGLLLGRKYKAHRLIWFLVYGEWPAVIDHINGDTADNRLLNLRSVTHSENQKNAARRRDNASGHPGVHYSTIEKRWKAYINSDRLRIHLGTFRTKEAAVAARVDAQREYEFHANSGR